MKLPKPSLWLIAVITGITAIACLNNPELYKPGPQRFWNTIIPLAATIITLVIYLQKNEEIINTKMLRGRFLNFWDILLFCVLETQIFSFLFSAWYAKNMLTTIFDGVLAILTTALLLWFVKKRFSTWGRIEKRM